MTTNPNHTANKPFLASQTFRTTCSKALVRTSRPWVRIPRSLFGLLVSKLKSSSRSGFEYWTDPDNPSEGFITWQSNGQPTYRLGASSVGPDQGDESAQIGQRRIPEEPMVRRRLQRCVVCQADLDGLPIYRLSSSTWVFHVSSLLMGRMYATADLNFIQKTGRPSTCRQ